MKLRALLQDLSYHLNTLRGERIPDGETREALLDTEITVITDKSGKVVPESLFFCIKGAVSDGHAFAGKVLESGAGALVVEKDLDLSSFAPVSAAPAIVRVESTRHAMAVISAAFYGNPAGEMKLIGITGTKGKTTTAYMIRSILEAAGIRTGLVGTIETLYRAPGGEVRIPSANTTPESIVLQRTFREMADSGVQAVVMEVSSQALMLERTGGFVFDIGIFTNLSPDHISPIEHKSFEEYLYYKSLLFRQCRVGIFNGDDPHLEKILEGHTCTVETYGLGEGCGLRAEKIGLVHTPGELGVTFDVVTGSESVHDGGRQAVLHAHVPAPGRFSVYNALCAVAVCRHFDVPEEAIRDALRQVSVRGRIEMVRVSDAFTLLIDYAHNAMALDSLLRTLREYDPARLVCVFGCGGNRARSRRFEMGKVSGELADLTIITSDNPRDEEPMEIIADIITGITPTGGSHVAIPDRREAIRYAIEHGQPGDIIVLAGKGHEDYQEIRGRKYPMDERVLIREVLEELRGRGDGPAFCREDTV
ncbi:MAG: UDP-N-acetylmuramoyl-L-alanyl-D-glutamate--2,6-diaminopimelate ligase [Eubacteriales bacterium]|nr:UDP-N-acetylmuramoyl-L-alanyl-D-glutamate--2,6-diaminopimelate ligase [Eubacteriales bacterium]